MTRTSLQQRTTVALEARQVASSRPFISVVVPVRNEEPFIRRTLEQLLQQSYDRERFEVIVADGTSTDGTCAIVRALCADFPNLRLIDNPKCWSSAGRNLGIRAARGEIIVIVDGHCELNNSAYLRAVADAFERSGADCLGRPQPLDVAGATSVQRAIAAARSSRLGHHPSSFIYSGREQFVRPLSVAAAYRRSVFEMIGLFDEDFDACEDVELNYRLDRAGLSCFFTPRIAVHYHPRSSLWGLFKQMARYGRGRARLLRKHPETFTLPGFMPALFMVGVVVGAAASWLSQWLALVYMGTLTIYGLALAGFSLASALRSRDPRTLPWLATAFMTIHAGAGYGILRELIAGALLKGATNRDRGRRDQPVYEAVPSQRPDGIRLAVLREVKPSRAAATVRGTGVLNALTIDVEDYFHVSGLETCVKRESWDSFESRVEAGTYKILDALDRASVRGTFFVLGWAADRHPDLVRAIDRAGHEIGCHTYWHHLIYSQTQEEFREDLTRGRDVLQDIIGKPVRAFRAPSFSITRRSLWALDVLIEEGFDVDSSIYPTHHDRYGIPESPCRPHRIQRPAGEIWEMPMSIYKGLGYPLPIGGGGYFRLYPYSATRHGLRAINRDGRPFVAYLHPWELDPGQPRLAPGRLRAFRHYVNLHLTERRLERLLQDFSLGTISDVLAGLGKRSAVSEPGLARAA